MTGIRMTKLVAEVAFCGDLNPTLTPPLRLWPGGASGSHSCPSSTGRNWPIRAMIFSKRHDTSKQQSRLMPTR